MKGEIKMAAANVKCFYCKETFDRNKVPFAKVSSTRYAHANCAKKFFKGELPPIINPQDLITCKYCKKQFNKFEEPYVKVSATKYAHESCHLEELVREKTDEEKLELYIMELFNTDYVLPAVKRQIKEYIEKYNFSHSGILKALIYYYEVKKNPTEKAHGQIGIVPYIYKDAYNYYYALWEAQQKNLTKIIDNYVPEVEEIHIPSPQKKVYKRKLFSFLDDSEEE